MKSILKNNFYHNSMHFNKKTKSYGDYFFFLHKHCRLN